MQGASGGMISPLDAPMIDRRARRWLGFGSLGRRRNLAEDLAPSNPPADRRHHCRGRRFRL